LDNNIKIFFNIEKRDLGLEEGKVILNHLFPEFFDLQEIKIRANLPKLFFENILFYCPVFLYFKA
jgi:hypothetical protein